MGACQASKTAVANQIKVQDASGCKTLASLQARLSRSLVATLIERAEIEASKSALCAALGLLHRAATMSPAEWAFLGATALWNAILLYTATPQGGVFERRLCCAVCPVACVLYLALGQLALGGGACYGRAAIDATSEDTEVAATVPCALFGALFAQSVVQCAVARARPAKGRVAEAAAWPCAGV